MTSDMDWVVPPNISFEAAINLTRELLDRQLQPPLSEAQLESTVATLVQTENGARGFFVTYLSDDRDWTEPSPVVVAALRMAPTTIAPLLVKNLVMSTAMGIHHRRHNDPTAQGSDQVQQRAQRLIQQLVLPELQTEMQAMAQSLETGTGSYQLFLDRWGYDQEQRQAMQAILSQTQRLLDLAPTESLID